ncbi:MAG: hypothetical protein QXX79_02925, partial [Candidatus Bathyarchaeia archaeon]
MALEISILIDIIIVFILVLFLLTFAFMVFSFLRWFKVSAYPERVSAIKIEDYACPKCGSKDLELIGSRTIRCKKCGTIFTIRTGATQEGWVMVWPFFWFLPFIWPIPSR